MSPELSNAVGEPADGTHVGFSLDTRDHPAALFWGLMLLASLPFLWKYCAAMWSQDLYQYFPFLLAAVFGLAYLRFDHRFSFPITWWARSTMVLAVAFLIPAAILQSSWLGAVSFVFMTASFFGSLVSKKGHSLAYLALPMVMFVRAPLLGTYTVMNRLQTITTNLSSIMLDVFGIIHFKSAHTIELVSKDLFVAEACSGVQSLFTICFLSLLLMVYQQRSLLLTPIYLLLAVFFAIVGNVIRVTAIAMGEEWFRVDLSIGLPHELVGYAALAIATGMLVSFDHLIGMFLSAIAREKTRSNVDAKPDIKGQRLNDDEGFSLKECLMAFSRTSLVASSIVMLCGVAMAVGIYFRQSDRRPVVGTDQVLFEPSASFLSRVDAPIRVVAHEVNRDAHGDRNARHGMNSDVWTCGIGTHQGQFVLSQPYMGWHELTICYKVQSWEMIRRETVLVPGYQEPIVVADFSSDQGEHGCLVFTAVDSNGRIPPTPGYSPYARAFAPFYPLVMDDFAEMTGSAQTVMLQYWMIEKQPISDDAKQSVVETMAKIRQLTSQQIERQYAAQLASDSGETE